MLPELLENRAALYVSGAMTAPERENFELLLEFHEPLRERVRTLQEVGTALIFSRIPAASTPAPAAKSRLFNSLAGHPRSTVPEGIVVAGPGGTVEWVNAAFCEMCGYSLEELRGRKPGSMLQGPDTDPAAVARMRQAVREHRPCREVIVNYHKAGHAYRVDVSIAPVLDDDGAPLYYVARERELGPA